MSTRLLAQAIRISKRKSQVWKTKRYWRSGNQPMHSSGAFEPQLGSTRQERLPNEFDFAIRGLAEHSLGRARRIEATLQASQALRLGSMKLYELATGSRSDTRAPRMGRFGQEKTKIGLVRRQTDGQESYLP